MTTEFEHSSPEALAHLQALHDEARRRIYRRPEPVDPGIEATQSPDTPEVASRRARGPNNRLGPDTSHGAPNAGERP